VKALSLTQPWATLVAIGAKRIETRSWPTKYRGPLAIHAAKSFPKWAREFTTEPVCYEAVRICCAYLRIDERLNGFPAYPTGAILATCRLANCLPSEVLDNRHNVFSVSLEPLSDQERAFGDYSPGRFAWILEDVKLLPKPIPVKGSLGLWEWQQKAMEEV
jgi:activating signal cointegrator 1